MGEIIVLVQRWPSVSHVLPTTEAKRLPFILLYAYGKTAV